MEEDAAQELKASTSENEMNAETNGDDSDIGQILEDENRYQQQARAATEKAQEHLLNVDNKLESIGQGERARMFLLSEVLDGTSRCLVLQSSPGR